MSALGHYLEDEGIATTGVSLVREHTLGYRPPRFLWVPFPLGRPFGAPRAPAFQRQVLRAALALLEREDGPVILEDFPHDAPAVDGDGEAAWACPVSFPSPPAAPSNLEAAVRSEVRALATWYELARTRRGRTTVGLTGASPEDVATFIAGFLHGTPPALCAERTLAESLKLACEDLKAYYAEATLAQPGSADADAMSRWFWQETAAARLLRVLEPRLLAHDDPELRLVASEFLIPRAHAQRG